MKCPYCNEDCVETNSASDTIFKTVAMLTCGEEEFDFGKQDHCFDFFVFSGIFYLYTNDSAYTNDQYHSDKIDFIILDDVEHLQKVLLIQ